MSDKRFIDRLRKRLDITEEMASDAELLEKTKNSITHDTVKLELAFEDFGKAAKPIADKISADFKKITKRWSMKK